MSNYITINGKEFPQPSRGLNQIITTAVNAARNANGVVIGQVIGRNQYKIDNLEWKYLTADQWADMLDEFSNFYVNVKFPAMDTGEWKTLKMYPGDRTATPFHVDPSSGLPLDYIDCRVNIIDVGEAES